MSESPYVVNLHTFLCLRAYLGLCFTLQTSREGSAYCLLMENPNFALPGLGNPQNQEKGFQKCVFERKQNIKIIQNIGRESTL